MNVWRMIQRCVVVVLVALQSVTWTSMATELAMANVVAVATVGCAATPVAQRYPHCAFLGRRCASEYRHAHVNAQRATIAANKASGMGHRAPVGSDAVGMRGER